MKKTKVKISNCKYLSEYLTELPSHCLINKGITGCGGTTVELKCPHNSIILVPTIALIKSKMKDKNFHLLGVYGKVDKKQIIDYICSDLPYKKIMATYDSLPRLIKIIPNWQEYFLLIDEYHLLFNDYSFRREAVRGVLTFFRLFNNWCFLTTTPINNNFILDELKDIDQIEYEWDNAQMVNISIRTVTYVLKDLALVMKLFPDRNLHIFLNSITSINNITKELDSTEYRVVCAQKNRSKVKNYAEITGPVRKYNFYTSCAYEGADLYDPIGMNIIVSDTNISTTILDVSTKVRQICGRIRNSVYGNQLIFIVNANSHRYLNVSQEDFNAKVAKAEATGKAKIRALDRLKGIEKSSTADTSDIDKSLNVYVNTDKYKGIFFDKNLKKIDIYNYKLVHEIYGDYIQVIGEFNNSASFRVVDDETIKVPTNKLFPWLILTKIEYTYEELYDLFAWQFNLTYIDWNQYTIKKYFPPHTKTRKTINGKKQTIYTFDSKYITIK